MKDERTTHNGAKRGVKPGELTVQQVSFPCRTCGAEPGQSCWPLVGNNVWTQPHADRVHQAEEAQKIAVRR